MKTKIKINNYKAIKQMKKNENSISHNFGYDSPMPWLSSEITSIDGIDHVLVRGSEFLTSVGVFTGTLNKTNTGDCIYSTPINPVFFSGTRLLNLARVYQKYKFRRLVIEYVPIVPSTQNGSVVSFFTYDPNENIFTLTDSDTRLREAMSHLGASMTNVYSYARTSIVQDDQVDSYYCRVDGDSRLEQQGVFYIMAGSSFEGEDVETELPLANLIFHYEVELIERGIDEDSSTTLEGHMNGASGTLSAIFVGGVGDTLPAQFTKSGMEAILASAGITVSLRPYHLIQMIPVETVMDTTTATTFNVFAEEMPSTGGTLLSAGSVWYIKMSDSDVDRQDIFTNIGDALLGHVNVFWNGSKTSTDTVTFFAKVWVWDTRF
jgi:hypothetical protein